MAIKKGRELTFQWNGSKVGDIISIDLTVDGETVDVSTFDSGDWTDYLEGAKNWNIDLEVRHNPEDDTVQDTLESDHINGSRTGTVSFGPETPSTGDVTYTGDAIITSFNPSAGGRDDNVTSSFSLQGTGSLTRNVAS